MKISGKKILVIVIMVVLASSVVAGATSLFNRSNNSQVLLNDRINNAVDSCLKSLPKGTPACDGQLGPALNKICSEENNNNNNNGQLDACHNGKVAQYYKVRNVEISKRSTNNLTKIS
jgi:peptidoglycan hydrolase CwlO-like protein